MKRFVSDNLTRRVLSTSRRLHSSTAARSPIAWIQGTQFHSASQHSHRFLSTSAAQATAKDQKKKNGVSDMLLDHLGKIFLLAIAGVIATIVRSSRSTTNRNEIRDMVEKTSALDPVEIDELRLANSELTPRVFTTIVNDLLERYPQNTCSYHDFTHTTRSTMARLKGGAFTIQLGHLVDRVAAEILAKHGKSADDPLPLKLWLTTLSLTLNSSVEERIEVLYNVMQTSDSPVVVTHVQELVGYLQDTCQLPPDTQIVPTETKYPAQQWQRGTPEQLVPWDGSKNDPMDLESFSSILRSKSVCAWGECYHKKKMWTRSQLAKYILLVYMIFYLPAPLPNCTTPNRPFTIQFLSMVCAFSIWLASMPHPISAFNVRRAQTGQGKYDPTTSENGAV